MLSSINNSKFKKPFLIGEIGINHNGSLSLAKKLINLAVNSGIDAIKFQKRDPDISTPEDQKYKLRQTPWGERSETLHIPPCSWNAGQVRGQGLH